MSPRKKGNLRFKSKRASFHFMSVIKFTQFLLTNWKILHLYLKCLQALPLSTNKISVSFALTKRPICLDAPIHAHVGRTVLKRDFDDSPNQLEEGKIQDILQQCGRMAYSCFNWAITVTMNMPLEKLDLFTSMVAS
ncbi:hypothetical protein ACJW31_01G009800 [Castanea mollissima]